MKQKVFKTSLLLSAINGVFLMHAGASTTTDKINHQTFRDFGENKGAFVAGATAIPVYDNDGKLLGNALPTGVPMPDMSASARRIGITTLVGEQLVVTAQHNPTEYLGDAENGLPILFGNDKGRNYQAVDRNDANGDVYTEEEIDKLEDLSRYYNDIALPRLDKMVTEVAPTPHFEGGRLNPNDYAAFARTGSGIQGSVDGSDISQSLAGEENEAPAYNYLADGYEYLTGGVIPRTDAFTELSKNADPTIDTTGEYLYTKPFTYYDLATNTLTLPNGKKTTLGVSPLNSATEEGDSGSGLYGYNKKTKRWELVGVVSGAAIYDAPHHLNSDTYTVFDNELLKKVNERYYAGTLDDTYSDYRWGAYDDFSRLSATDDEEDSLDVETGKDLYINHNATITLDNVVNQGSGGIYVGKENADSIQRPVTVTITGEEGSWEGSGVWVGDGSTLILDTDTEGLLPKLGKGTLIVQGTGDGTKDDDEGKTSSLSLGDGVVILAQNADDDGVAQAFDKISIVSGRGTLVLGDDKQMPLEDISFGYRGGRLDLNGLDLSTTHILNDDDGATLVNHNSDESANLLITGQSTVRTQAGFDAANINGNTYYYRSPNPKPLTTPTGDETDSLEYVYLGKSNNDRLLFDRLYERTAAQKRITVFAGMLGEPNKDRQNGELNVTYAPLDAHKDRTLLLTGGSRLNGTLAATGGTLLLSGRPAVHAIDWQNEREVMPDDTWLNRSYHASNLVAQNNAKIYAGRNIDTLAANISASGQSQVNIGFDSGNTPVCVRSDFHYETNCTTPSYDKAVLDTIPVINAQGDVRLTDSASLNLYRTDLTGKISASDGTAVSLGQGNWTMTGDSSLNKLALKENASITLNPSINPERYHTLNVNTLTGQGQLNYKTHLADFKGDKINVKQTLDGQFTLAVADKGGEPTKTKEHLTLLDASGANRHASTVALTSPDGVSLGAYRYQLQNDNGRYYLASAALEQEIDQPAPAEEVDTRPPVAEEPDGTPAVDAPATESGTADKPADGAPVNTETLPPVDTDTKPPVVVTPTDTQPVDETEVAGEMETAGTPKPEIQPVAPPVTPEPPEQPTIEITDDPKPTTEPTQPVVDNDPVTETGTPVMEEKPVGTEQPVVGDSPVVETEAPAIGTEEPVAETETPVVVEPETPVVDENSVTETETPVVNDNPATEPEKPTANEKPIETETPSVTDTQPSAEPEAPATGATPSPVTPQTDTPIASDRPVFFTQKDITSNLSNLALTDLTQNAQDIAQARKANLIHLLKDEGENFWLSAGNLNTQGKETALVSAYDQDGKQVQFGGKKDIALGDGKLTLGGAYTTSTGKTDYRGEGYRADRKQNLATIFAKQTWGNTFVALDASYGKQNAAITALGQNVHTKRDVKSLGVNAGKRFAMGVDIEPSVGVNYDHIGGVNYHIGGAAVDSPSVAQVSYRAGVGVSKTLTLANGATIKPMLASHYVKSAGKRSTLAVNGVPFVQEYGDYHYHEAGVGAHINGVGISLKGNYATGDNHKKQTGTSLEFSYRW